MASRNNKWAGLKEAQATGSIGETGAKQRVATLIGALMAVQATFVSDTSRFKSLRCPRRAGKTMSVASDICISAESLPDGRLLYVTQTIGTAEDLIINSPRTGISAIGRDFDLGIKYNKKYHKAFWPNGCELKLAGASDHNAIEKLRGDALDGVWIDEAGTLGYEILERLVSDILEPRLMDRNGKIIMTGTPGYQEKGLFFDVTPNMPDEDSVLVAKFEGEPRQDERWSMHSWTLAENTKAPELWERAQRKIQQRGWSMSDPHVQREYLGLWATDTSNRIFRVDFSNCVYKTYHDGMYGLPPDHMWNFVMGIDFGYRHDTAFVVVAYSDSCPIAYQCYEFSQAEMTIEQIANQITHIQNTFGEMQAIVGDFGQNGRVIAESINAQYGFNIQRADKKDKMDHVEIVDNDLHHGRVKLQTHGMLRQQMEMWIYDRTGKKEARDQQDHLIDAFIYTIIHCHHHFWSEKERKVPHGTNEWIEMQNREAERRAAHPEEEEESYEGPFSGHNSNDWGLDW